jgi:LmbE family N-acetylglucosaminyl deacetylase
MRLKGPDAEAHVPGGGPLAAALGAATHAGVVAHQDDLEILAYQGIWECYGRHDRAFVGVCMADGGGSPRTGRYACHSDAQMKAERRREQHAAAGVGRYGAVLQLNYSSAVLKRPAHADPTEDLVELFAVLHPQVLYTHHPCDRHPTHVAVVGRLIDALRLLPAGQRPGRVYGAEVWGSLDWLPQARREALDVSGGELLGRSLLEVFRSQIDGGKDYGTATLARRRANATFDESHRADDATSLIFASDLTPLVEDPSVDLEDYALGCIEDFSREVVQRIRSVRRNLALNGASRPRRLTEGRPAGEYASGRSRP